MSDEILTETERLYANSEALQIIMLADASDDLIQAGKYLALKQRGFTMQQIADELGYASRQSIYELTWKWEADGTLEKARRYFLLPALKEIKDAIHEAFEAYPEIIRGVVRMAKACPDPAKQLAAADWVREHVIEPTIESNPKGDSAEQAYISGDYSFQPTNLEKPRFLKKLPRGAAVKDG